jgi:hypothetical protein
MMTNLEKDKAAQVVVVSNKIDKILAGQETQIGIAALNLTFIKIVLSQKEGMVMAQAMAATFLHNAMNTIISYYSSEDEPVH